MVWKNCLGAPTFIVLTLGVSIDASAAAAATGPQAAAAVNQATDGKAEDSKQTADTAAVDDELNEVVVTGLRISLESAVDKKQKASQIMDSVSAEDIGKLPDNNVVEALAHVPGVQITRQNGQGADVAIRGMQEVGTTINGNSAGGGEMRSLNHNDEDGGTCTGAIIAGACNGLGPTLGDIPPELVKSIEVYKTRTADQIEGGTAGVVNLELRRPLDMKKGWTLAGSANEVFSNLGDTKSPSGSLLVADRFNTPLGEMGWLLNAGFQRTEYQELQLVSESPNLFLGGTLNGQPLPAAAPNLIVPYKIWNGVLEGTNRRPSFNLSTQWRTNSGVDFVLEGTYIGSRLVTQNNYLELRTQGDNNNPIYSNVAVQPDGRTVRSLTMTAPAGNVVPLFADSAYSHVDTDSYTSNFEVHWHGERLSLGGTAQYSMSNVRNYDFYTFTDFNNLTTINADFDSPKIATGGAAITLPSGYSLTDPNNYNLLNFHDELNTAFSHNYAFKFDATYDLGKSGFLRSLQSGVRYTDSYTSRFNGYRDSFPNAGAGIPLTSFPTGSSLASTNLDIFGPSSPTWLHLGDQALFDNLNAVRACLQGLDPNLPQCKASATRYDWSTATPGDLDQINSYHDYEHSAAYYAQFNYGFKAYFPIDGVIGARVVRTWGGTSSTQVTATADTSTYQDIKGKGQYTDVLPSANAIIHLRPDTQLRLAYTGNVERAAFAQLSPFIVIDQVNSVAYAGNPDLQPNKIRNFDLSLEHYFGRGGLLSLAAYRKLSSASFFYYGIEEFVPGLGKTAPVYSVRNAGDGTFQGYEFNVQSFFDFLPGFWRNFGSSFNYTYNQTFKIIYPTGLNGANYTGTDDAPNVSKYTYNAQLYYDTPKFSARLAYNYRAKYRADPYLLQPGYTPFTMPTSRLDAAINYTPIEQLTLVLEGSNLLNNDVDQNWNYSYFPADVRIQARTIEVGFRFRL